MTRSNDCRLIDWKTPTWIVAGAGISATTPAAVPLWGAIKVATYGSALEAFFKRSGAAYYDDQISVPAEGALYEMLPEEVLEWLCLSYGRSATRKALRRVIVGSAPRQPTAAHCAIARLAQAKKLAGIVTLNFDDLFEQALRSANVPFQVHCNGTIPRTNQNIPLLKIHGSIEDDSTLVFRREAYYRGLPQAFWDYLRVEMRWKRILIVGYSGFDSDLFPLLRNRIEDPSNISILIEPQAISDSSPFLPLVNAGPLVHCQTTSDEYFANRRSRPPRVSPAATILPSDDRCNSALFLALAARRQSLTMGSTLFYHADDIAASNDDKALMAVAAFGRALCSRHEEDAGIEFSFGLGMVEDRHVIPIDQLEIVTDWLMLALWHLTRFVLASVCQSGLATSMRRIRQMNSWWVTAIGELPDQSRLSEITTEWSAFGMNVTSLLEALMEGTHRIERSGRGILDAIQTARSIGQYQLELDGLELLRAVSPGDTSLEFDLDARSKTICEVVQVRARPVRLAELKCNDSYS